MCPEGLVLYLGFYDSGWLESFDSPFDSPFDSCGGRAWVVRLQAFVYMWHLQLLGVGVKSLGLTGFAI